MDEQNAAIALLQKVDEWKSKGVWKSSLRAFHCNVYRKIASWFKDFPFWPQKDLSGMNGYEKRWKKSRAEIQSKSIYLFFMCFLWAKQFFGDCRYKTWERGWNENGPGNWNKIAFTKSMCAMRVIKIFTLKLQIDFYYCCVRVIMKAPGKLCKIHLFYGFRAENFFLFFQRLSFQTVPQLSLKKIFVNEQFLVGIPHIWLSDYSELMQSSESTKLLILFAELILK